MCDDGNFDETFISGCTGSFTSSSVASDENVIKMKTLSFQYNADRERDGATVLYRLGNNGIFFSSIIKLFIEYRISVSYRTSNKC